ncbi:ABC-2 family transporter protein [Horticoccus luteus]|uniref:ABC-2 family transporter protein n=1 Tax=Horticoccus luteus TaxID=2862869 RepID=A0A8F9XL61_9BACT|nr:ABC-2 family transporter protein [Horticoccus luteus]QYM80378.1 ABC-2 family transporter protein [Horticoccus luteus]
MWRYLQIWAASARYAVVRSMMFRFDFLMWALVEFFWIAVNLLLISVIYSHTDSVAGWSKYEMLLLVGTSLLIQRLLMGLFWSSLFELGRNVRSGGFDFFLAQPGNPLFMASTRKLDPDSLVNLCVAIGVVGYSAHQLGLHPSFAQIALYALLVLCGLVVHYSILVLCVSLSFWITNAQGVEGSYFTLAEFSRLPREAFRGAANVVFVWLLPTVIITNAPARTLLHGFAWHDAVWLVAVAAIWFVIAIWVFQRGIRRYSSASS